MELVLLFAKDDIIIYKASHDTTFSPDTKNKHGHNLTDNLVPNYSNNVNMST
jgi:hypothetical protein